MLPLLGIFLVLTIASGAASHWQTPSGWQSTNPTRAAIPKVPPRGTVRRVKRVTKKR